MVICQLHGKETHSHSSFSLWDTELFDSVEVYSGDVLKCSFVNDTEVETAQSLSRSPEMQSWLSH